MDCCSVDNVNTGKHYTEAALALHDARCNACIAFGRMEKKCGGKILKCKWALDFEANSLAENIKIFCGSGRVELSKLRAEAK